MGEWTKLLVLKGQQAGGLDGGSRHVLPTLLAPSIAPHPGPHLRSRQGTTSQPRLAATSYSDW